MQAAELGGRRLYRCAARAYDIVVASPEIEKNEELAAEIRACGGEAMTVNLDVTSLDSVKEAFSKDTEGERSNRCAGE